MGYTSVHGGLDAIHHAEQLIRESLTGGDDTVTTGQIARYLSAATAKAMAEGSLYDPRLGALAVKQAEGDLIEASFLLRAYRSTLPRLGYSLPSRGDEMRLLRRISAAFKDLPGGQLLGRTRDYTQRLLDFTLTEPERTVGMPSLRVNGAGRPDAAADAPVAPAAINGQHASEQPRRFPVLIDFFRDEGLLPPAPARPPEETPFDVTREPLRFPASRSARFQVLARGEAGAMVSLAYAAMRGFGAAHAYVGEIRGGDLPVNIAHPITGRRVRIGWIPVTEAHTVYPGKADLQNDLADFTFGYGITIGADERKVIAMGIIDENLTSHPGASNAPIQNEEYVLHHIDAVEASGFVEHLKLPHYVTFQSSIARTRRVAELARSGASRPS